MRLAMLLLCLGTTMPAADPLQPFVLPWDDGAAGPTSLADWSPVPAGTGGRVCINDSHLAVAGRRLRLWGVNITAGSCFPDPAVGQAIARRLRKFGVNCVRFHHMDAAWASPSLIDYGHPDGSTRHLHADSLARLDAFVAALKAEGIYANLNLLVHRRFREADGLAAGVEAIADLKTVHVAGMIDGHALSLHQEYATQLLTHVNPHTGLSYAVDPAVAIVEVLNEQGLVQAHLEAQLELLPQAYLEPLRVRWNDWLRTRYGTQAQLLAAWGARSEPLQPSFLVNGDFRSGGTGWILEQHAGAAATATFPADLDGRPCARIDITAAGSAAWHVQVNQGGHPQAKDLLYTVSFLAKAGAVRTLAINVGQAHDPWQVRDLNVGVELTTAWQPFTFCYAASIDDADMRLNFSGMGLATGPVWIGDVTWRRGGVLGLPLPPDADLDRGTIPFQRKNDYDGATPAMRRDWITFLAEVEAAYWQAMRTHLAGACGYPGIVVGTARSCSSPNLQASFGIVDAHAYWNHPEFPGRPWDPVNWRVGPDSMVQHPPGTLAEMAGSRVAGLPMLVTEYNHPAPNRFGGEAPLFAAAYGALQDLDGVFMFDYTAAQTGMIGGFFDISRHPTKMANLVLGAALFRRGDLAAATVERRLNITPADEARLVADHGWAWGPLGLGQLGMPALTALVDRVAADLDPRSPPRDPPPPPAGPRYESDTGALAWDLGDPAGGLLTWRSRRSCGLLGFAAGRSADLDGVIIAPGAAERSWCAVGLTLLAGEGLGRPCRGLVVATGTCENTGMGWNTDGSSVGDQWGSAPTRIAVIPCAVTLPRAASQVEAWALDEAGQRTAALAVEPVPAGCRLALGPPQSTLWYEVACAGSVRRISFRLGRAGPVVEHQGTGQSRNAEPSCTFQPLDDRADNVFLFHWPPQAFSMR